MNRYTIRCTSEQTKKALELGAPLYRLYGTGCSDYINMIIISDTEAYTIPTAEEIIGWLDEQGIYIEIGKSFIADYQSIAHNAKTTVFYHNYLPTREEATYAAIDAALEYLSNKQ